MIKKVIFANALILLLLLTALTAAADMGCMVGKMMYTRNTGQTSTDSACPGVPVYDIAPGAPFKDATNSCFATNTSKCYLRLTANSGGCGTFRTEINCPLDNNVWILLVLTATMTVFFFRNNHFVKHIN